MLRIRAAVDARRNPDFVIIARTDAVAVTGLDDAIARAQQYVEAGADVAFIEALETREQMARAIRDVKAPHLANMVEGGKTPNLSTAELADIGFKLVIYPWAGFGAAFKAMRSVWAELRRTGTTAGFADRMEPLTAWSGLLETDRLLRDYGATCCRTRLTVGPGKKATMDRHQLSRRSFLRLAPAIAGGGGACVFFESAASASVGKGQVTEIVFSHLTTAGEPEMARKVSEDLEARAPPELAADLAGLARRDDAAKLRRHDEPGEDAAPRASRTRSRCSSRPTTRARRSRALQLRQLQAAGVR